MATILIALIILCVGLFATVFTMRGLQRDVPYGRWKFAVVISGGTVAGLVVVAAASIAARNLL